MNHLTRNDYASALQVLARIEAQAEDVASFARAAVRALNGYVASELTTLSICDLFTGHCQVVGLPGVRLAPTRSPVLSGIFSSARWFCTTACSAVPCMAITTSV